ncbi:LPP20 family lipoprotein [Marinomonas aquimarina]|nr:LPP20 family lipoprotein [Marinomonas aquimarina]
MSSQTSSNNLGMNNATQSYEIIEAQPRDPIIVNATGYSAPVTNKALSKAQARLMSLRGSKLDAYRNLSERVYGISLDGSSSLSNMMAQHDDLRTYVNAYLVGAKVISQRELEDGTFETVVELALQENFRQCAGSPEAIRSNPNCQLIKRSSSTTSTPKKQPSTFYSVQ